MVRYIINLIVATVITYAWLLGSKMLGDYIISQRLNLPDIINIRTEEWPVYLFSSIVLIIVGMVWAAIFSSLPRKDSI